MKRSKRVVVASLMFVLMMALCSSNSVFAQEAVTEETVGSGLPQLGEQKLWPELEKIFGQHFSLNTDEDKGSLTYELGESGGLKLFKASGNVVIDSDLFSIACDSIEYKGEEKTVQAQGNPVVIRQQGVSALCGKFSYNTEKRRSELTSNPMIFSKADDGSVMNTEGNIIYIEQDENDLTSVMIDGNARLTFGDESNNAINKASKMFKADESVANQGDVMNKLMGVFGKNFSLTTDKKDGRMIYQIGDPEGMKYFQAKYDVKVESNVFDLKSDVLEYQGTDNLLIATGKPVNLNQQGISATSGRFIYNTLTNRSVLSENPAIYSRDESGRTMKTVGKQIIIEQNQKGIPAVLVEGNASIVMETTLGDSEKKPSTRSTQEAVRLDQSNLQSIKELQISE